MREVRSWLDAALDDLHSRHAAPSVALHATSRSSGNPGAISRLTRGGLTTPWAAIHSSAWRPSPRAPGVVARQLTETAAGDGRVQFHVHALEARGGVGERVTGDA